MGGDQSGGDLPLCSARIGSVKTAVQVTVETHGRVPGKHHAQDDFDQESPEIDLIGDHRRHEKADQRKGHGKYGVFEFYESGVEK